MFVPFISILQMDAAYQTGRCSSNDLFRSTLPGLPCMEVRLNGSTPLQLFLDLASNSSYLSAAAAKRAKLAGISESLQSSESSASFKPITSDVNHVQVGTLVLSESFAIIDPINALSLETAPRRELSPGDGGLSYTAFANRLVILDFPHQRLRVSTGPYRKANCSNCSRLQETSQGDFTGNILATDGFAIDGKRVKAVLDPLYPGAVLAMNPVVGLVGLEGKPIATTYRGGHLLFVRPVSVTFGHHTLAASVPLVRADDGYDLSGTEYDVVIGLSLLSQHTFALDFRNKTMQLDDYSSEALIH